MHKEWYSIILASDPGRVKMGRVLLEIEIRLWWLQERVAFIHMEVERLRELREYRLRMSLKMLCFLLGSLSLRVRSRERDIMERMRGTLRTWRVGFVEFRVSEYTSRRVVTELQIWMVMVMIWLVQHSSQIYGFEAQS
jgi:hypothetical protein